MSFIHLESIVKDWAKAEFDALANKKQKKLRRKEKDSKQTLMNITIDWSELDIVHDTVEVWYKTILRPFSYILLCIKFQQF